MAEAEKKTFFISGPPDVVAARRFVRAFAIEQKFSEVDAEQLVLVVAELGSNIHKHAIKGTIMIDTISREEGDGIVVEALDWGGGIDDPERAFGDGFSTAGTLGDGLGAVNRLVDFLEITSDGERGTHIIATKLRWPQSMRSANQSCPLDVAAASRCYPSEHVNGDAFVIKHWNGHSLLAVIDGVGHGKYAHKASSSAKAYIETHFQQSLDHIFMGAARACRATRGAVMTLVRIDWENRRMQYAGVGNIETRIHNSGADKKLAIRRGIVGVRMPPVRVVEESWGAEEVMVLFSDGISSGWQWHQLPLHQPAGHVAQHILRHHGRDNDDATVLVIKERRSD